MKMIAKITVNEEKLSIYTLKIILTIAVSLNIF